MVSALAVVSTCHINVQNIPGHLPGSGRLPFILQNGYLGTYLGVDACPGDYGMFILIVFQLAFNAVNFKGIFLKSVKINYAWINRSWRKIRRAKGILNVGQKSLRKYQHQRYNHQQQGHQTSYLWMIWQFCIWFSKRHSSGFLRELSGPTSPV